MSGLRWLLASLLLFGVPTGLMAKQPALKGPIYRHAKAAPYDLTCNYLKMPLGIDDPHPTLSWKMPEVINSPEKNNGRKAQIASSTMYYAIVVGRDSAELASSKITDYSANVVWNSGFRPFNEAFTRYQGVTLNPYTRYYWKVICTSDTTQISGTKAKNTNLTQTVSYFETGLQSVYNWKGAWIADNHPISFKPAGYFRKDFAVHKKIKSARIYIAAAGLYKLMLNGKRVGHRELDPVYTRFDKRLYYTTYDVTQSIEQDQNSIGVILGNGWYNLQSTAVWGFDKAPWRARPCFVMDLRIVYEDGSVETVATGKDWKTRTGPIVFNSIYTAEHHDHRLMLDQWDFPQKAGDNWHKTHDSQWQPVKFRSAPSKKITSAMLVPIRKSAPIYAVSMHKFSDTDYVFNIGQNIAGISEIKVKGKSGTVLRVKHGERLYKNGHVDLSNIDVHYRPKDDSDPFQTDIYTLSGNGEETFRPWFGYKGFQYVEITSSEPISLNQASLTAFFMHSDVPVAGHIHSSDTILNKIWAATNQSYLSNLMGYPTDCPQREKNGWTGDGQINIETGLYNFDAITVYRKWMQDHLDEQQPNGVLPSIIPTDGWGYEWGNGTDWTSSIAIIPWNLYLFYGDSQVLRQCYDGIKHYVDYTTSISPNGICSWGLGDWVPVHAKTPVPFTSTIYYYTDVRILAEAAKLFGKMADYDKYSALALKIKTIFNDTYLNKETGIYDKGYQTEMSAPLYWGITPKQSTAKVAAALNKKVVEDGYKLDVGLLGSKTILDALSMYGYHNAAYKMASSRVAPSWGWWMVNGATTLYENWNIESKHDISLNHIMFGQIGAWMFRGLGGILPDPTAPGFKHTLLRPAFPDDLNSFQASHETPFGKVGIQWHRMAKNNAGQVVVLNIVIPTGTTATLYVPFGYKPVKQGKRQQANRNQANSEKDIHWRKQAPMGPYSLNAVLDNTLLSAGNYTFVLQRTNK